MSIIRNIVRNTTPHIDNLMSGKLALIGDRIRSQRKALRISATVAAEAAGISRVTLHRIEKGVPSVAMANYLGVIQALGLDLELVEQGKLVVEVEDGDHGGWLPVRIRLADYPQLKQLAWQVHGTDELTPAEALNIYERNWRHLDFENMELEERNLISALRSVFMDGHTDV